jgi:energy-coupling factor transporter transmembrane protein EcfT
MQESYLKTIEQNNKGIKLDPRIKILVLIVISILVFTDNAWYVLTLAAAIPLSLLVSRRQYAIAAVCAFIYAASLQSYVFFNNLAYGIVPSIVINMITYTILRMMPGFIMGYFLLTTTSVSEFIASMERMYMPKQIIIPLTVMFRFMPTIKEEAVSISNAMKMGG